MKLLPIVTSDQINTHAGITAERILEIAKGREIVLLVLMDGAIRFANSLLQHLDGLKTHVSMETLVYKSYHGTKSGSMCAVHGIHHQGEKYAKFIRDGKLLVVVDDILDTGATLSHVLGELRFLIANIDEAAVPFETVSAVMLTKDCADRRHKVVSYFGPDYTHRHLDGLRVPESAFVVGAGLDYNGRFRGLRDVCLLEGV